MLAARCRSAVSQYLLLMSCTKVIDEASVCCLGSINDFGR